MATLSPSLRSRLFGAPTLDTETTPTVTPADATTTPADPAVTPADPVNPAPVPPPAPEPAPAPVPTFDDLITVAVVDTATLAQDQAAADALTAAYNSAIKAATDKIAADKAKLAADTAARDAAIVAAGSVVVVDNGDGTFVIYEPQAGGQVVTKSGVSSKRPMPPV